MTSLFRNILRHLPHLVRRYLSKKRSHHYQGLFINITPGVFHPGLFFSTKMLLQFLEKQSIKDATVLEIGAGTGIISLLAAKMGAKVTATDISQLAIENIRLNARKNNLPLNIIQSDLFENLPAKQFDWILVNPPYYAKQPMREEEFAWYCGEHHEYFIRFFTSLPLFITIKTNTVMVLSDVCNLPVIFRIGSEHNFEFVKLSEKNIWVDGKNYIFQIKQIA